MSLMADRDFLATLTDLDALQARPERERRPTRFHARALLVPLGEALLEGDADVSVALARARAILARDQAAWQKAIHEELTLAATEHVRSCDARFLKAPNYDFPYTVAARHRLEARLRAASELEFPADDTLLDQIERADRVLEPHLRAPDDRKRGMRD